MDILMTVTCLNVEAGGVATAVCGLAEALKRRQHRIVVATLDAPGTSMNIDGVEVKKFNADKLSGLYPSSEMREYLNQNAAAFDAIHIHGIWQRPGHYASRAAQREGIPYVVSLQGMLDRKSLKMGRGWAKKLAWMLWEGPMMRHAGAVHCLTDEEYRVSPWIHGLPILIAANGVALSELDNLPQRGAWRKRHADLLGNSERPVVVYLARIHPKKGLPRLLSRWPDLLKMQPQALLVIAGTGANEHVQEIQTLIEALHLEKNAVLVGQLSGTAKWELLADADVYVLPSYQEGLSLATAEAMGAGLPVVITRECNFQSVESHQAGMIIDHGDMNVFVLAVQQLLADPMLRKRMGENGAKLIRREFTWDVIAQRVERAYQALAGGERLPAELGTAAASL
jgi:glycosyltransferase involved in cell wall biosynthesis